LKVASIYNENKIDPDDVINIFGITTEEHYSKKTVDLQDLGWIWT